ncbi:hypothetical protein C8R45DRAFT_1102050 [Mycena sanguinolenta]|nr:hypothetical protein C8R45DRAFT_1102050 [Mycena sanguinolenta]
MGIGRSVYHFRPACTVAMEGISVRKEATATWILRFAAVRYRSLPPRIESEAVERRPLLALLVLPDTRIHIHPLPAAQPPTLFTTPHVSGSKRVVCASSSNLNRSGRPRGWVACARPLLPCDPGARVGACTELLVDAQAEHRSIPSKSSPDRKWMEMESSNCSKKTGRGSWKQRQNGAGMEKKAGRTDRPSELTVPRAARHSQSHPTPAHLPTRPKHLASLDALRHFAATELLDVEVARWSSSSKSSLERGWRRGYALSGGDSSVKTGTSCGSMRGNRIVGSPASCSGDENDEDDVDNDTMRVGTGREKGWEALTA